MAFIAGAFTAQWTGPGGTPAIATIGQVENGFTIEYFANKQLITGDNFAQAPQDAVMQGLEVFVEFTLLEWNAANAGELFWPYDATFPGNFGTAFSALGKVGTLDSARAGTLTLTAVTNTPSATLTSEDVYTFTSCVIAEGFPVRILLNPELRTVPLRLRVYPSAAGVYFTTA